MESVGRLSCPSNVSFEACRHDATAMQGSRKGTFTFAVFTIDDTSGSSAPPTENTSSPPQNSSSPPATSSSSPAAAGSP
jgi:hypothetical protein